MIQYIIGGAVLLKLFLEITDRPQTELTDDHNVTDNDVVDNDVVDNDIVDNDLIMDYAKSFEPSEERVAKIHATKTINRLIKEFKTSSSDHSEESNSKHPQYEKMYSIIESTDEDFIHKMESVYNAKYIDDQDNKSYKIGSTGKNEQHFLYFVATKAD